MSAALPYTMKLAEPWQRNQYALINRLITDIHKLSSVTTSRKNDSDFSSGRHTSCDIWCIVFGMSLVGFLSNSLAFSKLLQLKRTSCHVCLGTGKFLPTEPFLSYSGISRTTRLFFANNNKSFFKRQKFILGLSHVAQFSRNNARSSLRQLIVSFFLFWLNRDTKPSLGDLQIS